MNRDSDKTFSKSKCHFRLWISKRRSFSVNSWDSGEKENEALSIFNHKELDKEKEDNLPLTEVSVDDILDAQRREQDSKNEQQKLLSKALKDRGLNMLSDLGHDDMF
ncbi:hypothetical protein ACJJTC_006973 [Scirpophaga incertulas]